MFPARFEIALVCAAYLSVQTFYIAIEYIASNRPPAKAVVPAKMSRCEFLMHMAKEYSRISEIQGSNAPDPCYLPGQIGP